MNHKLLTAGLIILLLAGFCAAKPIQPTDDTGRIIEDVPQLEENKTGNSIPQPAGRIIESPAADKSNFTYINIDCGMPENKDRDCCMLITSVEDAVKQIRPGCEGVRCAEADNYLSICYEKCKYISQIDGMPAIEDWRYGICEDEKFFKYKITGENKEEKKVTISGNFTANINNNPRVEYVSSDAQKAKIEKEGEEKNFKNAVALGGAIIVVVLLLFVCRGIGRQEKVNVKDTGGGLL